MRLKPSLRAQQAVADAVGIHHVTHHTSHSLPFLHMNEMLACKQTSLTSFLILNRQNQIVKSLQTEYCVIVTQIAHTISSIRF